MKRLADREGTLAWLFLMPSVVYILALVAVPFILAVGFAVSDVTAGDPSYDFVGLKNFSAIFDDPVFWRSLGNTFLFTGVSMILIVIFGKVLANILVADFKGKWVVRFLVLLPWTTPATLGAISWLWLLDSIFSPIDWVLRQLGLLGSPGALLGPRSNMYWLGEPGLAMASVIAVHVWRLTPLAAVIMMAGLVAIPRDMDEAARVDGAGYWRRMFEVTIPLTLPVIAVSALFGAIFTFTDMAVVDVLTNGGPNNATQVLTSWAFFRGIDGGDVGQGAAVALFLFPLLLAAAIAILRAVRGLEVR
jgi:multiple sugar transport system permease protein